MSSKFSLCPVCRLKFLTGRHKVTCMSRKPLEWAAYYKLLSHIDYGRKGRLEYIQGVSG